MPSTGLGRGLEIKVGWVLKNSGNSLYNGHQDIPIWAKESWDNWVQSGLGSKINVLSKRLGRPL